MISDSFPTIGDVNSHRQSDAIATVAEPEQVDPPTQELSHPETLPANADDQYTLGLAETDTCSPCRPHKLPPAKPTACPFPAAAEDHFLRDIENFLIKHTVTALSTHVHIKLYLP